MGALVFAAPHNRPKITLLCAGLALFLGLACTERKGQPVKSEAKAVEAPAIASRIEELARISVRNEVDAVGAKDIGHSEAALRRAAARSLARMNDVRAIPKLLSLLSDEDPETIAFAAHGLGALAGKEGADAKEIVGALVTRSVSLPREGGSPFDPIAALVRALGRFDLEQVEPTLVAWLELPAPFRASAALALGELASRTKTLSEATQKALVSAVEESPDPLEEALFAIGRLDRIEPSLRERLLSAAAARLTKEDAGRLFAIRALGRAGSEAAGDLARVLTSEADFNAAERAEAARSLARLGQDGEHALTEALASFMAKEDPLSVIDTDAFGPFLTAVEMLRGSHRSSRERLRALSTMAIPEEAPAPVERRITRLRCAALQKLSTARVNDARIAGCDREAAFAPTETAKLELPTPISAPPLTKPTKLTFVTDAGSASIVLDPKLAPIAAARFVELAKRGHFDGAAIPLLVPGSFVQLAAASESEARSPLPRETSPIAFEPFTVGVALDRGAETGSDKLFVTLGRHPELDGNYAFLGRADEAFAKLAEGDVIERVIVDE